MTVAQAPSAGRGSIPRPDWSRYGLIVCAALILGGVALALCPGAAVVGPGWTSLGIPDGLLGSTVHCLASTASGDVLVGTSGGLNVWREGRFHTHSAGTGLPEGYITAALHDGRALWAGSWGGGLGRLAEGRWQRYDAENSALPGDWISALTADAAGLWIATYGHGLARLEGSDWTLYRRDNSPLPSDWLTALAADARGGLWVGTERAGLAYLDARGRWATYTLPFTATTEVTALAAQDGGVWVGTRRGLAMLESETETWRTLGAEDAFFTEHITALAVEEDGSLWVGTMRGLGAWDGRRLSRYTLRDGLPHGAVSALALDTAGRLWVGSPVRGVTVRGEVSPPRIERLPVVLVHGWRGPESDRLEDSEFWHLARWLREDGFTPYYATGIHPANTLHRNAARLRQAVAEACRETGSPKAYVVAFSMGGLNTRAYLESTLYAGDVAHVFILGTPHRGEHLWSTFLLWESVAWSDEPSTVELLPIHAELLNATHRATGRVPYTLIAGDAQAEELPTLFRELPPGDGLVSTWSALGPPELLASPPEGVAWRITDDIHAWGEETILLDIPSLLLPRTTYDAHIRPVFFGLGGELGSASAETVSSYSQPLLRPRSALRTGRIAPGEALSLPPIPISERCDAHFYVRWKGPALEVRLRDPLGRVMDADETIDRKDVEYLELGFADFAGYV
ncbi:MAG: hypothetical protein FJZ90_10945, partial [Chloroflexi bacterium]|nr:hypothetical protein [Chloroflexota bacterium]